MIRLFSILLSVTLFCACSPQKGEVSYILPETRNVVIYQVNPRLFAPEKSFLAIISHLDSIQALGCNVIWLMPVFPIGEEMSKNSPYSVKDYTSINPEYGTLKDFKLLVREAHKRGLGVILDWVANHTAWDNEWIKNEGWYTRDEQNSIIYPEGTDWTDVADLNYDNDEMRQAMIGAMSYWVKETGIDGFRCDVADFVPFDFWKECIYSLKQIGKPLLMLAEGTREDHFEAGFDLSYGWDFAAGMREVYRDEIPAYKLFDIQREEYSAIPEGKRKLRFTTNHDEAAKESPLTEWCNREGSMSAFATIAFLPGCPLVYGSQEVGYPGPIDFFRHNEIDWKAEPDLKREYRKILTIRKLFDGLRSEGLTAYPDENILLFERFSDQAKKYLIAINTRISPQSMNLPENLAEKQYVNLKTRRNITLGKVLELQPFEYLILSEEKSEKLNL